MPNLNFSLVSIYLLLSSILSLLHLPLCLSSLHACASRHVLHLLRTLPHFFTPSHTNLLPYNLHLYATSLSLIVTHIITLLTTHQSTNSFHTYSPILLFPSLLLPLPMLLRPATLPALRAYAAAAQLSAVSDLLVFLFPSRILHLIAHLVSKVLIILIAIRPLLQSARVLLHPSPSVTSSQ